MSTRLGFLELPNALGVFERYRIFFFSRDFINLNRGLIIVSEIEGRGYSEGVKFEAGVNSITT